MAFLRGIKSTSTFLSADPTGMVEASTSSSMSDGSHEGTRMGYARHDFSIRHREEKYQSLVALFLSVNLQIEPILLRKGIAWF